MHLGFHNGGSLLTIFFSIFFIDIYFAKDFNPMLDPPELSLRHYLSEGDINTCNILTLLDSGGFVKSFRTKKIISDFAISVLSVSYDHC